MKKLTLVKVTIQKVTLQLWLESMDNLVTLYLEEVTTLFRGILAVDLKQCLNLRHLTIRSHDVWFYVNEDQLISLKIVAKKLGATIYDILNFVMPYPCLESLHLNCGVDMVYGDRFPNLKSLTVNWWSKNQLPSSLDHLNIFAAIDPGLKSVESITTTTHWNTSRTSF